MRDPHVRDQPLLVLWKGYPALAEIRGASDRRPEVGSRRVGPRAVGEAGACGADGSRSGCWAARRSLSEASPVSVCSTTSVSPRAGAHCRAPSNPFFSGGPPSTASMMASITGARPCSGMHLVASGCAKAVPTLCPPSCTRSAATTLHVVLADVSVDQRHTATRHRPPALLSDCGQVRAKGEHHALSDAADPCWQTLVPAIRAGGSGFGLPAPSVSSWVRCPVRQRSSKGSWQRSSRLGRDGMPRV